MGSGGESEETVEDYKQKSILIKRSRRTVGFDQITKEDMERSYKDHFGGSRN